MKRQNPLQKALRRIETEGKKHSIEELYGVLFGRGEKPKWMT